MSASVIRRGLELFSEKDGAKHKQKRNSSSKKRIRQLQRAGQSTQSNNNTVKDKHIRSAVDEYRKKQKKSQLSSNLKYFLRTSSTTQKQHTAKEVQQSSSRRSCDQPDLPEAKPKETSVFTEQEFQTFQQEYFSRLWSTLMRTEALQTSEIIINSSSVPLKLLLLLIILTCTLIIMLLLLRDLLWFIVQISKNA